MKKISSFTLPSLKTGTFVKNIFILFLFIILIMSAIWISFLQFRSPEVLTLNSSTKQFSAERAMSHLKEFAVKPHPLGSEEHDRVRDYLMKSLKNLGVSPEIQKSDSFITEWGIVYDGKIENIIARIPGKDSSKAIMIASHYDSVPTSPGAADDGSGVASILETVRILSESPTLKNDVIILITDGEESGLLGAQAFVNQHPWAREVGLVFNFEARGSMGPSVLFETSEGNSRLISEFIKGAPNPVAHSFIYNLYKVLPHDTDLTIFKQSGMQGLNFGFFEGESRYHTNHDNIENLSLSSLQHHGDYMVHLVQHFGNLNLVEKKEGNKIYFNVLGRYIITYSELFVIPIMFITIGFYIFSFIHGHKRKKVTLTGTSLGFFLFLITLGLGYTLGRILWGIFSNMHPENTQTIDSNVIFVGMIFILFSINALVYQLVSKKINVFNLTMGALLAWLLLLVITSVLFIGSSYIFAWPLLFGLIGLNLMMKLEKVYSLKGYIITIGFTILVLLLTAPVIYLMYILLTLKSVGVLLALISLLGVFIIPILSTLKLGSFFGLPVLLLSIGTFFLFWSNVL
ncbi:M20/M25/M40 family metallo-hydrolase [Peribacillus sp. NPDC097206]|uniref:M20/M25/M40 family metallo-hydrolase n=1 Tax=unclassified Peribacillus TaxID=2675266 RepID=UPI00382951B6